MLCCGILALVCLGRQCQYTTEEHDLDYVIAVNFITGVINHWHSEDSKVSNLLFTFIIKNYPTQNSTNWKMISVLTQTKRKLASQEMLNNVKANHGAIECVRLCHCRKLNADRCRARHSQSALQTCWTNDLENTQNIDGLVIPECCQS